MHEINVAAALLKVNIGLIVRSLPTKANISLNITGVLLLEQQQTPLCQHT